jgi:hypothetical protein
LLYTLQNAKSVLLTLQRLSDVTEHTNFGRILAILEKRSRISYLAAVCDCPDIEMAINIDV